MNCRDIDELMCSGPGNPIMAPEAVEHLLTCWNCCTLTMVLDEGGTSEEPTESQLKRIRTSLVENLRPVQPLAPARFLLFACATIFLCTAAIGAMPFAMSGWDALSMAQRIAVFTTVAASAALLAISMVGQMAPGSRYTLAPARLPIAILATLLLVIAATFRSREERAFLGDGMTCMKNGLTYSIPAAFLFGLLVRRGAILFPKLIGAAAGGLAGLVGLSVLEINCSNLNVLHILVWHWGVILISSGAGTLLGAATEYIGRWRRQPWQKNRAGRFD